MQAAVVQAEIERRRIEGEKKTRLVLQMRFVSFAKSGVLMEDGGKRS